MNTYITTDTYTYACDMCGAEMEYTTEATYLSPHFTIALDVREYGTCPHCGYIADNITSEEEE